MYFVFFSLSFSVFLVLLVCRFCSFLVASFDKRRPLLVASHSVHWQINFVRSFVFTMRRYTNPRLPSPLSESYTETEMSDAQWASHVIREEIYLYF